MDSAGFFFRMEKTVVKRNMTRLKHRLSKF